MARPVIEVEMLPVTKDEDARNDCESKTKTAKDVDTCQSETEDLIRMLQEALDLRDDGAEKKSPARSRPLSARSSMSSTSSSRVVTRSSSSLSAEAVRKIEKENARLLQRITKTAGKRKMAGQHPAIDRRVETSSMVNRRRADERISRENAALLQRIQSVKPSRSVSVETHRKHFTAHRRYSQNASRLHGYQPQPSTRPHSARIASTSEDKKLETQYTWEAGW